MLNTETHETFRINIIIIIIIVIVIILRENTFMKTTEQVIKIFQIKIH
jgi:hypothetical protein